MKPRVLLVLALSMFFLTLLGQPVSSAYHWETTQIVSGHTWATSHPVMWGDRVYYNDRRSGNGDVYVWDAVGGEQPLITGTDSVAVWGVYEDKLVVTKYANSQYDLYLWDPVGGMQPIATGPGNQYRADISGDLVVFEDYSNGLYQVYMWDPVNGSRPISPTGSAQWRPRVDQGRVVWEDLRHGRGDVYMWTAEGGVERLSTYIYPMQNPDVYCDRVVMYVPWQETMWDPYGMWEWQADHGITGPLVEYKGGSTTRMWGDLVAWGGGTGVGTYHPSVGYTKLPSSTVESLDVYGNSVVWSTYNYDTRVYDILIAELVPEPSALLALAGGCTVLLACRRRRRS